MLFHARKGTLSRFCTPSRKRLIHRIIYTNKNNNVMKKNNYVTPESELLIVRFEENILSNNTGESFDNTDMQGGFTEDGED